jgi:hypothetical protein
VSPDYAAPRQPAERRPSELERKPPRLNVTLDELGLTEEAAAEAAWCIGCDPHMNLDGIEYVVTLMEKYEDLTEDVDPSELVWPGALEY